MAHQADRIIGRWGGEESLLKGDRGQGSQFWNQGGVEDEKTLAPVSIRRRTGTAGTAGTLGPGEEDERGHTGQWRGTAHN